MSTPHAPRSLVLGILGGIAAGKSAVGRLLAGPAGVVIDADALAREVLESAEVRAALVERFGPPIAPAGRPVDRGRLGELVFADPAARATLESLTHPRVRARVRALLDEARRAGAPRIVLDVPLLLENDAQHGLVRECDVLVFVDADARAREARARASRGWAPGEVARREAAQMPLADKRARADFVLANSGDLADLERDVQTLLARIEGGRRGPHRIPPESPERTPS
ncbi:MAG: dephospho-CoA kinase [Planctomycetes bacterium]|nr:dephospho-CoA kinase [Planctomycetota bacterium]